MLYLLALKRSPFLLRVEASSVLQLVLRDKRMFYVLQLVLLWNMMEKYILDY